MKRADKPRMLWEEYAYNKEQKRLREEHGVAEENVVVVERKNQAVNALRVVLRFALALLRILANIAIAALAIVGLATLIFPETRAAFWDIATTTFYQIKGFVGL